MKFNEKFYVDWRLRILASADGSTVHDLNHRFSMFYNNVQLYLSAKHRGDEESAAHRRKKTEKYLSELDPAASIDFFIDFSR